MARLANVVQDEAVAGLSVCPRFASSKASWTCAAPVPPITSEAFPGAPSEFFWSSTTYAENPAYAWDVSFSTGFSSCPSVNGSSRVRCVR